MSFGEEVTSAQRISGLGYGTPPVRKDYTGYEKEAESGLEFAQARYQNPIHGRFTSVDPLTASATIRNPQSFNRYTYVLNSPYKFTDPLGLLARFSNGPADAPEGKTGAFDGSDRRSQDHAGDDERHTDDAETPAVEDTAPGHLTPDGTEERSSATSMAASLDPASLDPFVISNAAAFFEGLANNPGYFDATGKAPCAWLPLGWENSQDSVVDKLQGDSKVRMTPNWVKGDQVVDNMQIAQGTVLASGWEGNAYLSKPSGNHVVVFDKFDTYDGKRGMWVAEQMNNKNGPRYWFKPFDSSQGYVVNAGGFHVVRIVVQPTKVDSPNTLRRVIQE